MAGGEWRLTTEEKKRILLNHIYGVDIDPQAVEVTKLSLLLKVLEGESADTLQMAMFQERALPDLSSNIKCGNSLIGPDFYDGQMALLDEEEMYRINVFDWESEFPEIMRAGGFDAVIGNPPYIQLSMEQYYSKPVANYLARHFSSSMGRLNTFGLFFEKALADLAKSGGYLGYIVPNTVLTQGYYESLREMFLARTVGRIASHEYHVFQGAVVEPVIIVIRNSPGADRNLVHVEVYGGPNMIPDVSFLPQSVFSRTYRKAFPIRADIKTLEFKEKIDSEWPRFGELLNINQAIALKGDRSLSLHAKAKSDNYHPVLDGREIGRYETRWNGQFLEYNRARIHSCKRTDIFECEEKIFFRRVGETITATLDRNRFYALNTLVVITPNAFAQHQLSYLLGIFNSSLLDFYYCTFLKSTKRTFSEIQARQVGQLPIRTIDFNDPADVTRHDRLVALVEQILALHKQLAAAKTPAAKTMLQRQIDATDRRIDRLVYELYALTEEEIGIVEAR